MIMFCFLCPTIICLYETGSYFEDEPVSIIQIIITDAHRFSVMSVTYFHVLLNINRLDFIVRVNNNNDDKSFQTYSKSKYLLLICAAIPFGSLYAYSINYPNLRPFGLLFIVLLNVGNTFLEIKLYVLSKTWFEKTRGLISLNQRYELFSSLRLMKSFIPASIIGLIFKFVTLGVISSKMWIILVDNATFYFSYNLLWNIDSMIFPWFFLFASWRIKIHKTNKTIPIQHDHFEQLRKSWN
ncbi:unnamed protein product [Caenorhabditis angaria]|uniref:Uncharacterized protein n=1 Tax=Caenorhabditis angaria TaxID=860376 RepID=A0A9P1IVT8_9PELO|nr:unnamed protein product [Caenorhabditis angaria]